MSQRAGGLQPFDLGLEGGHGRLADFPFQPADLIITAIGRPTLQGSLAGSEVGGERVPATAEPAEFIPIGCRCLANNQRYALYWWEWEGRYRRLSGKRTVSGHGRSVRKSWTAGGRTNKLMAGRESGRDPLTQVGYARVSTHVQDPALQLDALRTAGCATTFEDRASGTRADRTGLRQALDYVRDGDVLVIWKQDRLGRSVPHLIETVGGLEQRGVGFRSQNVFTLANVLATALVAVCRRHDWPEVIALFNLLLGWTVVGWFVLLVWALRWTPRRSYLWRRLADGRDDARLQRQPGQPRVGRRAGCAPAPVAAPTSANALARRADDARHRVDPHVGELFVGGDA